MYRIVAVLIFYLSISIIIAEQHNSYLNHELRIVGGKPGKIENFPYLAALLHRGIVRCGSSIINENTIVTAAHCFKDVFLEKLKVRVGSAFGEKLGTVIDVADYVIHPKYSMLIQNFDLAVVWLKSPIVFEMNIQPISLPEANEELPYGQKGVVAGWGRISEKGSFPDNFHFFQPVILKREKCIKTGGGGYDTWRITDAMFCAGFLEGGKDSCKSDSGGPFVVNKKLVGVVSFGEGCARPKLPGVYANVAFMRSWLDQVMSEKKSGKQFTTK